MNDILLEKVFSEPKRWEDAISIGVEKGINKSDLRKLTTPDMRLALLSAIINDDYKIMPPHQALIPKDTPGEFRTVYINENIDRILLSIINNLFFEMYPEMIHKSCKSYQVGIGCGKVVQEVSSQVINTPTDDVGYKMDLSKYFDSVPIQFIDEIFDKMEKKTGQSKIIDIVRAYYHTNLCFDVEGNLVEHYQSLKQGCAIASFLADAMLYDMDNKLSSMKNIYYVRYSDDILCIGPNYKEGYKIISKMLSDKGLTLNPKKVELLNKNHYFKFLGFNIKGADITLSKGRTKDFQREIESRTINIKSTTLEKALHRVNDFLYYGDGRYSWATSVLPIITNQKDLNTLNSFVMDCLRACKTGKKRIGGLGNVSNLDDHCILRGTGRNVKANKAKTEKIIAGYMTLGMAQKAILTSKPAYDTLVRQLS